MAGWMNLVNEWLVRALVLSSLAAHLVVVVLAAVRRREASGWRRGVLWLANQVADLASAQTLGNLFLGSTSREKQLVAFWVSFLLIHMGRPDNISAYSMEDSVLSARSVMAAIFQIAGAIYVLIKHIINGGGGGGGGTTFVVASIVMFLVGIVKYTERIGALWLGDLGSIQSSGKKLNRASLSVGQLEIGDDEQALLAAHRLMHITKGAFADYSSVEAEHKSSDGNDDGSRWNWSHGWEQLCRLVEMELSLMYDVLYTKAAVIHTWHGYCIRFATLLFTAVAFWLFWLSSKHGYRWSDVCITYLLLVVTFVLEVRWLLRALASTWTHAFFTNTNSRLRHAALCSGRWRRFRRFVVSLDLRRVSEPSSYRMWSGKIGQYNLLYECTRDKEYKYHYSGALHISSPVRDILFNNIWNKLKSAYPPEDKRVKAFMPIEEKKKEKKEEKEEKEKDSSFRRRNKLDKALGFAPELQDDILTDHLATDIFLQCSGQKGAACAIVKTIELLSNYMLFLVIVRPYMLPGLKIRSTYTATRDALHQQWCQVEAEEIKGCSSSSCATTEWKLASNLSMNVGDKDNAGPLYDRSVILHDGARKAKRLLKMAAKYGLHRALETILGEWVKTLIYVSTRCSRDSHAKQLSHGGELTTIVWMLAEHASIFLIAEDARQW
ncbi:hypothetical protein GUJ93_ZPchr0004g39452 [Zizania palustris]|uniref:DUF4220 domain-containing protein n=1 Tax=Zizania palustris TaxID=103762 RepID=A0A8J5SI23_ZIZPA|nr:hypothetical protein GUJ93_ZPchr0004g39452 [Zizania palustris]